MKNHFSSIKIVSNSPLNLGVFGKLSGSSMSRYHCSLAFLFASVKCGLILLVWRLMRPSFRHLNNLDLLTCKITQVSSTVVLSLRQEFFNASKSNGTRGRPTLPRFLLATSIG